MAARVEFKGYRAAVKHYEAGKSKLDKWVQYRTVVPIGEEPASPKGIRLRDDLIIEHMTLAKQVAANMVQKMPTHVDKGGIESLAYEGLMRAVCKYNHTINDSFEAYATQTMQRRILDGLRELDWAPRSLRRKMREIEKTEETLKQRWHRSPTDAELADELSLGVAEIQDTRNRSEAAAHAYIEDSAEALNMQSEDRDEETETAKMIRVATTQAVKNLPFKEALVICLHYYENKTLADVAALMGVSEVKVGSLHKDAVLGVWAELAATLTV
jgi:RNA polymerase sigma factor for flagellar operon FliA